MLLREIPEDVAVRSSTGISELDRVLGGGIVEGALMLIGGDPGIGKSTLLLQVCANLCKTGKRVLYVSGEESAKQLKLRANRLGITSETLYVLAENALDNVEEKLRGLSPDVAVIDSIQTMYRPDMASAPGSVSQIRECTSQIMRLCKESGTAIFLVGHVTKDGAIAGRECWNTWWTSCCTSRATVSRNIGCCARSKTASGRSMSWAFSR